MTLHEIDIGVFVAYVILLISLALWISREKGSHQKNTKDYFLASKSLPWWAIGASLIASNISAEQIIGMSGSGYAIGLAIASYEWMAALTLIIVGKYMLPIFLENKITTMPEYLEKRFDEKVKVTMAIFWLLVYVFVNLTAVLWLGSLAIETVTGAHSWYGMGFLVLFALAYSLYGGLKAVAYTDILQVVLLIFGGMFLSYAALNAVSGGNGAIAGFYELTKQAPAHFDMILDEAHPHYVSLPGISVLVGGLWIMNFSYWGFNQYIIQRALAAKNIQQAQKGIAFAAYIKLLMPLIVVLPGIAAVVLHPSLSAPDKAYPTLMALMPIGIKGLVFAALIAAIVSSLASMVNSVSTIFTMDLYAKYIPDCSEKHYVGVGRTVAVLSMLTAMMVAQPLLGNFEQAFQYIQEFTGFFTPGIVVIFLLGMFWPKATSNGALSAAFGSAILSLLLRIFYPELPFIDRIGIVFLLCAALCVVVSLCAPSNKTASVLSIENMRFDTSRGFNLAALGVILCLTLFYSIWW